jgi:pimeloyl-ACP methyl ester carboxylesterase
VVIYHPGLGGTFEDNAVACEFLASYGYVVISSAYEGADSTELNINGDLATSSADLSVLLRFAATLPYVDASKVAAMGHSYGAQAVLGWRAQPNSPLDAVVFLDSTVEYVGLDEPRFAHTKASLERNVKSPIPVVMFADRERQPKFETFDPYLKFAPRFEFGTPALEHNAFVSQGAMLKDDAVRRTYESVCIVALKFLDAYLKADAPALQWLHAGGGGAPLHMRYRAPAPLPPTGAQLAHLYRGEAPAPAQEIASLMKASDAETIVDAASVLFDAGQKKEAITLLQAGGRVHARSAVIEMAIGEALQQTGDAAGAASAFDKALALLPADDTLNADEKARVRKSIEEAHKK